jgi:D-3-phosphoglycerate dehydrogenase
LFQEAGFEVEQKSGASPEELAAIIGAYDGLVLRSATRVTAELLTHAKSLKIIGRAGAGVDTIDVPAATAAGIRVMNTPGQNANGVAELVFGLMFALARHIPRGVSSLKAGRWEKSKLGGTELLGKSIGIIGYGAIGRRVGAMAGAMDMNVMAYDPFLTDDQIKAGGAAPAALEKIYSSADFITLHLPKTKETANMVNAETLAQMKPTACLINCARGGLVDEAALAQALSNGKLAGAAMDVFAQEPPAPDNPLLPLDNFIGTPHLGASTAESQVNVARAVAQQMIAFFNSGDLTGVVNP